MIKLNLNENFLCRTDTENRYCITLKLLTNIMIKLNLNENFISRIWDDDSYYNNLRTTSNEMVEIVDPGKKNLDAGPDYKEAKVKIGGILYSGCIEIHRSMRDWNDHHHKNDNKYNEVILQVVFYKEDFNSESMYPVVKKARSIPTIILSDFLTKSVREIWKEIISNPSGSFKLPCYPKNLEVGNEIKAPWISGLSVDRLFYKSERINCRLREISDDISKKVFWEQLLFEFTCEALGYSKNKKQFLCLAGKIDFSKIKKTQLNILQIESLTYGLSGFLKELRFKDKYIDDLKSNWNSLREIFSDESMDKSEWNFFRLRPANFPTVRIAYASALLYEIAYKNLLPDIVKIFEESVNITNDVTNRFTKIEISQYWKQHYNFGKQSTSGIKRIGKERIKDIITNVVLPVINHYSSAFGKKSLKKRVEYFYRVEKQKSGGNEITRIMEKQLDVKVNSLSDEQGLIQLHNFYCVKGKCNNCEIGKIVFANEGVHEPLKIILY